jgi:sialic acid synthase SpsE
MTKIIAEVCQNHLGNREVISQMIREAAVAGAEYVKGQIIFSEDLTYRERFEQGIVENNGVVKAIKRPYKPEFERLRTLDLTPDDYRWFVEEAISNKIKPMVTIFSRRRIELAAKLPWPEKIVKVASYDCASYKLLDELCDVFDHLVVSVGGTTDEEIVKAVETVKKRGKKLTLLHCVISYPNTLDMCNLARLKWLKKHASSVGWSDHTKVSENGLKAAKVAAMLGADMIERHFTVLAQDQTKDGPISVNPETLRELVEFCHLPLKSKKKIIETEIPDWQVMLGSEKRELTHKEMLNRDYYRGRFASMVYNWE